MQRHSTRARSTAARLGWFFLLASPAGCDPSELPPADEDGPPFLIVAPAARQPLSLAEGTSLYVQARGGDSIGILTHGCDHTYGALPDGAQTSCAALTNDAPFTFLVFPRTTDCVVEVRLYSSCNTGGLGANTVPLSICESQDVFITSVSVPVAGGGTLPRSDGGAYALDGSGDE